jgi:hypothetical protein
VFHKEIKRHNLQPKKGSLATRTAIKVKCSRNSSTVIGKKKKTNRSSKRKRNCTTEKESVNQSPYFIISCFRMYSILIII